MQAQFKPKKIIITNITTSKECDLIFKIEAKSEAWVTYDDFLAKIKRATVTGTQEQIDKFKNIWKEKGLAVA